MRTLVAITAVIFAMLVFTSPGLAQDSKHYEIVINGETYELNLGDNFDVTSTCGDIMNVKLQKKPYVLFSDSYITFQYNSTLSPSITKIEEGLVQIMLNTATGTAVMVQEYSGLDPAMLVPLMLKELTKEQVEYGYNIVQTDVEHTLASGKMLTGIRATMSYMDQESYYEVLSISERDTGIIVVTMIDKSFMNEKADIIDRFWDTMNVQF